jgi:hypothetical protein
MNASLPVTESDRLIVGQTPDQPLLEVALNGEASDFNRGVPVEADHAQISRLSSLLQGVPSLLVANEAAGKRLMEVVVNGDLARAADGNGFRAFVLGPKGIQEQARLFEVDKLQNLINAGALWQVASVLVAQKHLADINANLNQIKQGIASISQFLDGQRKARVLAAYDYLQQAGSALTLGEMASSMRHQIESIERDLLEVQNHLMSEFEQTAQKKAEDGDSFGTESLTDNLVKKARNLEALIEDMTLCLQTRILAWYVLCLFPGEPQLKQARRDSIEASIAAIGRLKPMIATQLASQTDAIRSIWNTKETIEKRKQRIDYEIDRTSFIFTKRVNKVADQIVNATRKLAERDTAQRYMFAMDGNRVLEVRTLP